MPNFKAVVKDKNGIVYTLSDNTYIGPIEPSDPGKTIWFDVVNNNIKVNTNGHWSVIGPGGCATVVSPTNMPVGPSVIIVTGVGITSSAQLSFASIPPAGSVVDIIILPASGGIAGWTLVVPKTDWFTDWMSGSGDPNNLPSGDTLLPGLTYSGSNLENAGGVLGSADRDIFIPGPNWSGKPDDVGPTYIRAISDGARVYYVYQAMAPEV